MANFTKIGSKRLCAAAVVSGPAKCRGRPPFVTAAAERWARSAVGQSPHDSKVIRLACLVWRACGKPPDARGRAPVSSGVVPGYEALGANPWARGRLRGALVALRVRHLGRSAEQRTPLHPGVEPERF